MVCYCSILKTPINFFYAKGRTGKMELTFGQQLILGILGSSLVTSILTSILNNWWTDRRLRDQWEREKQDRQEQWQREKEALRREWERQYTSESLGSLLARVDSVVGNLTVLEAYFDRIDVIDDMLAEMQSSTLMQNARLTLVHSEVETATFIEERLMQVLEEMDLMVPLGLEDRALFELLSDFKQAVDAWCEFWRLNRKDERAEDARAKHRSQVRTAAHKLNRRVKELVEETFD
jgi:hypothetical protein